MSKLIEVVVFVGPAICVGAAGTVFIKGLVDAQGGHIGMGLLVLITLGIASIAEIVIFVLYKIIH